MIADANCESEVDPEGKSESWAAYHSEVETEDKSESEAMYESEVETEDISEPESDPGLKSEVYYDVEVEIQPEGESETESSSKAELNSESEFAADSGSEAESDALDGHVAPLSRSAPLSIAFKSNAEVQSLHKGQAIPSAYHSTSPVRTRILGKSNVLSKKRKMQQEKVVLAAVTSISRVWTGGIL